MRDRYNHDRPAVAIGAAVLTADNTPAAIDLQGFQAANIMIAVGVGGITFSGVNKIEFKLTHSDDDVSYADVTDADVLGVTGVVTGIIRALTAAHAAAAVYNVGYIGGRRYLKLLADFSGTHGTGTPIAAIVNRSHPNIAPHVV
jgi:hypothetical protein